MPGAYLYGWDAANEKWIKLVTNPEGKLIIDPTEIFEDAPTDNEHGKAPTSNWAHDHEVDAAVHHARYTDQESVSAWGNRSGLLQSGNYTDYNVALINMLRCNTTTGDITLHGLAGAASNQIIIVVKIALANNLVIVNNSASAPAGAKIFTPTATNITIPAGHLVSFYMIYNTSYWVMQSYPVVGLDLLFDDIPVDGQLKKGITSNWAFDHAADLTKHVTNGDSHDHEGGDGAQIDHANLANKGTNTHAQIDTHIANEPAASIATHKADASAHHARYSDAEAVAAVAAADPYLANNGDVGNGNYQINGFITITSGGFTSTRAGNELYFNNIGGNYIWVNNASGFLCFGAGGRYNDIVLKATGELGIGATDPSKKLEVNGSLQCSAFYMPTEPALQKVMVCNGVGEGTWGESVRGHARYISGANVSIDAIFDALKVTLNSIGLKTLLSGVLYEAGTFFYAHMAERVTATRIVVYGMEDNGTIASYNMDDGASGTYEKTSLAW